MRKSIPVRGFSTTEFVLILAIIAILAAIAVPNFLETQVRRRGAAMGGESRVLATAIESYYVDHGEYPAHTTEFDNSVVSVTLEEKPDYFTLPTFRLRHNTALNTLTTPTAYTISYPIDRLADENTPYAYWRAGDGWILAVTGPDHDFDLVVEDYDGTTTETSPRLLLKSYDTTNGTVSNGDLWRVRQ